MLKIAAIMGSPRKGDSCRITQMMEERLIRLGDVDFEYIFLKDKNIEMCRGCYLCVRNGERCCPISDDVPFIIEKMRQADGLIFAAPVYALSIPGLMKNFMDRVAYNAHRPTFWGKKAMAIVTSQGTGIDGTLGFIRTWAIWGMEFVTDLGIAVHPTLKPTEHYNRELEKKLNRAAQTFYNSIKSPKAKRPQLVKVIQFNLLKYMSSAAKDGFPADFSYYSNKGDYYYDTRINVLHKFLTKLFTGFVSKWMGKNYILNG